MEKNLASYIKQTFHHFQCPLCFQEYNDNSKMPMIICISQHSICKSCIKNLFNKKEIQRCPQCRVEINKDKVAQFRLLNKIRAISNQIRMEGSRAKNKLKSEQKQLEVQLKQQRQKNDWLIKQVEQKQSSIHKTLKANQQLWVWISSLESRLQQYGQQIIRPQILQQCLYNYSNIKQQKKPIKQQVDPNQLQNQSYAQSQILSQNQLQNQQELLQQQQFNSNSQLSQQQELKRELVYNLNGVGSWNQLKNMDELEINIKDVARLPRSLCNLRNLKKIFLFNTKLTCLPYNIGNLQSLKTLSLCCNLLTQLPQSIGDLKHLQQLYISYNRLTHLPLSFPELTSLQDLNLSHNQLESLPTNFGNLSNLFKLTMQDNRIQQLPSSFYSLKALKYLFYAHASRIELQVEKLYGLVRVEIYYKQMDMNYMKKIKEKCKKGNIQLNLNRAT